MMWYLDENNGVAWCPVISDLDYFGLVISDANRWFRTVISDGVRWIRTPRWIRTVISDGVRWIRTPNLVVFYITILVLISLFSDGNFGRWFRTVISDGDFGRWFRTMISDGDIGRCDVSNTLACWTVWWLKLFYLTISVLISVISDGDFGRYYL